MREPIRDKDRLLHINECIENVNHFLHGKTFEDMKSDRMCFHAVVYNIMIIGEAANLLTNDFRASHSEVPWRDIIDMRNILVHGYYVASPVFIWETYINDLPPLKEIISRYLTDTNWDEWEKTK